MVNESDKTADTVAIDKYVGNAPDPFSNEEDTEASWRRLALQFDEHRMKAIWHLKTLLGSPEMHRESALKFISAPPLSGEEVLANRLRQMVAAMFQSKNVDICVPQYKVGDCLVSTVVYDLCKEYENGSLSTMHISHVVAVDSTHYTLGSFTWFKTDMDKLVKREHKELDGHMTVIGNIK